MKMAHMKTGLVIGTLVLLTMTVPDAAATDPVQDTVLCVSDAYNPRPPYPPGHDLIEGFDSCAGVGGNDRTCIAVYHETWDPYYLVVIVDPDDCL